MKTRFLGTLMVLAFVSTLFVGCQKDEPTVSADADAVTDAQLKTKKGFVHGIVIEIDGFDYYFDGPPDGPNGEKDVPGHYWNQAGPNKVVGKHYNIGPFGEGQFWASDTDFGEFLYTVKGTIDLWTPELAEEYAAKGYVHRHEFVPVEVGTPQTDKVIWLKHIAVTHFYFNGPHAPNTEHEHSVTPGVDWEFPNNWMKPYPPLSSP